MNNTATTGSEWSLARYFERVGFTGTARADAGTLFDLHLAHTTHIPFENLDVFAGKPISLGRDALFDKLVTRRRGGYCFEMNGLFAHILRELGFGVTELLARCSIGGAYGAKTHEVLLVITADGARYLADVGFGNDGIAQPITLEAGSVSEQCGAVYRIVTEPRYGYALERRELSADADADFTVLYAFNIEACPPEDFIVANHYTSTHPSSFFRMIRFCTMPTPDGRVTLTERRFRQMENGRVTETVIDSDAALAELMKNRFGLEDASVL